MKIFITTLAALVGITIARAQQEATDTTTLLYAFKKGKVEGHFRYFFMATGNAKGLSDYYAHAIGGGIKYETAPFKGFRFGVGGFFTYNISSSDLVVADPSTNQFNRYEVGLFDITDPGNKNDIDRLEELYLSYNWKNSRITFGKQLINTPFINLQDGRMRPTESGGLWLELIDIKNTKLETGFLYEISPRSTVKWYNIGESMGIYPVGVNTDGIKSGYAGNLESKGIALLGITYKATGNLSLKLWEVFVENIFNTAMLQADYSQPLQQQNKILAGVQYIRQDAVKDGGNTDPAKTYFQKNAVVHTFGAMAGWENKRWHTSLNYNRITAGGRYLFPREWGRDPFYTFMPRERNEGLGDVHAYVLKLGYSIPKARIKTTAGLGYFDLPDVTDYSLNKYGMPSYTQLNLELRYAFAGFLKGLDTQLLFVHKFNNGDFYDNDKYVINKVDMRSWNLVFNYRF